MLNSPPLLPESDRASAVPRHRAINWRQEYLHLTLMLMTTIWLAPWVALTLGVFLNISLVAALEICTAHLLSSLLLVRWMNNRRVRSGVVSAVMLLAMWAAVGITLLFVPSLARTYGDGGLLQQADLFQIDERGRVPAGPVIILWVVYLWRRSAKLGSVYVTVVRASFGLRLGILAFLWVCILAKPALREDILPLVPAFFFFGLLSSGLARADSLNLDRAGQNRALGRGWILSLVGIALLVTSGGYAAALWLTGISIGQVAAILAFIIRVVLALLLILVSPLLVLAQLVYDFLDSVLPDQARGIVADPSITDQASGSGINSPWIAALFRILSNGLMIAVVLCLVFSLLALLWFLVISRMRRPDYEDEERESLGTGDVVGGMRQTLRDGWRRLAGMLGLLRQFGLGRDLLAALTIRRIYARMERMAGGRGYPRTLDETPYEYRKTLEQAFPGQGDDIQCITEAYIAVRYGDVPEDSTALTSVREAWERLSRSNHPSPPVIPNKNG